MAKFSSIGKKKNGIGKLNNIFIKKLQKSLLLGKNSHSDSFIEEDTDSNIVPEDVKEGHFAIIAMDGEEPRRFVISLSYLAHPMFIRLLEQAAEEYGFDHKGAVTIPCMPSVIERILSEQWDGRMGIPAVRTTP